VKKAQLYRRPGAQFIFDGTVEEVLDRFNEVDPFEREASSFVVVTAFGMRMKSMSCRANDSLVSAPQIAKTSAMGSVRLVGTGED